VGVDLLEMPCMESELSQSNRPCCWVWQAWWGSWWDAEAGFWLCWSRISDSRTTGRQHPPTSFPTNRR